MAPAGEDLLAATVAASPLAGRYSQAVDRESAKEMLAARLANADSAAGSGSGAEAAPAEPAGAAAGRGRNGKDEPPARGADEDSVVEKVVSSSAFKSFLRSAGTVLGREITRSMLGTAQRSRRR
jgi:hypothetical protein